MYNCKSMTKNHRYFSQMRDTFYSENINECVPSRFQAKNM